MSTNEVSPWCKYDNSRGEQFPPSNVGILAQKQLQLKGVVFWED